MAEGDWIEHDGKGMPVDGDVLVNVKFKDGGKGRGIVSEFHSDGGTASCWIWTGDDFCDITHYRIVEKNDNG